MKSTPYDEQENMEEKKLKNDLLYLRKLLSKHKKVIIISISVLIFAAAFLATFCK